MYETNYNPADTSAVQISFDCPSCGERVESEDLSIPSPNYQGDNESDSTAEEEHLVTCDACGDDITILASSSMNEGTLSSEELSSNSNVSIEWTNSIDE